MSRILVVDDEPDILNILSHALSRQGYEVLSASSAEEALELVAGREQELDMLITDILMPGIGGRELVWRMLQVNPGLDVILCSGYLDEDNAVEMLDIPGLTFLTKPLDIKKLVATVQALLAPTA